LFRRNGPGFLLALPEFFLHAAPLDHLSGGKFGFYGPDTGYIFVGGVSVYPGDSVQFIFYLGQVGFIFKHFIEFGPVLVEFFLVFEDGLISLRFG